MISSRAKCVMGFDYVIAGVLTAVMSVSLAFAFYWLAPWGCDASAWLCLYPLSLLMAAPFAALCLPILLSLNRRRRCPFPDGWLMVIFVTAAMSQLLISGYSLWSLADYLRHNFLFEVLIFPQGLAAGATIGAAFCGSLALLRWIRTMANR